MKRILLYLFTLMELLILIGCNPSKPKVTTILMESEYFFKQYVYSCKNAINTETLIVKLKINKKDFYGKANEIIFDRKIEYYSSIDSTLLATQFGVTFFYFDTRLTVSYFKNGKVRSKQFSKNISSFDKKISYYPNGSIRSESNDYNEQIIYNPDSSIKLVTKSFSSSMAKRYAIIEEKTGFLLGYAEYKNKNPKKYTSDKTKSLGRDANTGQKVTYLEDYDIGEQTDLWTFLGDSGEIIGKWKVATLFVEKYPTNSRGFEDRDAKKILVYHSNPIIHDRTIISDGINGDKLVTLSSESITPKRISNVVEPYDLLDMDEVNAYFAINTNSRQSVPPVWMVRCDINDYID